VILAVGSDKGSPGATTLATVLGLTWPGDRVLCELDPRGADLPFRLMRAGGQHMQASPSIVTLAIDARPGASSPRLENYTQPTILGVPVIRGEISTRATSKVAPHLPAIAAAAADWPGTMIADVGSLQPDNPALVVAKAAVTVLLVTRPSVEGLGHLRDRVDELGELVGNPSRERPSVGVVLVADSRDERAGIARTRELLDSVGAPAPVVGVLTYDPAAAAALWSGPLSKKLVKSSLVRSAGALVREMWRLWPELGAQLAQQPTQPSPAQSWAPFPGVMDTEGVARW
jgi:hypothetical protein